MTRWEITLILICISVVSSAADPPYPPSTFITGVTFDFSSHRRLAPGSDNWPLTWSDDDAMYTAWGDGGGFGGTNSDGRVSSGFAVLCRAGAYRL